jgi:ribosome-binding factor A
MARIERLEALIRKEVAEILQRKTSDSRIGFISITDVEISKDMATATVYYSQLGSDKEKADTRKGLASAAGHIHYELCRRINYIKTVPKLTFRFDDGIERGASVLNIMKDL